MSNKVRKHGEVISQDTRSKISMRYKAITKAVNSEFRNSQSDTMYSLYVGSYGRGTAVDTSDIDILVELPEAEYYRFDSQKGNGQSRLLQAVKNTILETYPRTNIKADGQVVKVAFSDGMLFEVLPAFKNWDNSYKYPDTNMGGNWRSTNPKAEQDAMQQKNRNSNGLLYDTCKHIRRIRDDNFSSYTLSGIVIDCFVYQAIADWHWLHEGESSSGNAVTFEDVLLNDFRQRFVYSFTVQAPGSYGTVEAGTSITCLEKVLEYMAK